MEHPVKITEYKNKTSKIRDEHPDKFLGDP